MTESALITNKHYLVCHRLPPSAECLNGQLDYIKSRFCGTVLGENDNLEPVATAPIDTLVYICGDVQSFLEETKLATDIRVKAIKELSIHFEDISDRHIDIISTGEVPLNIHGSGLYFRSFHNPAVDYFEELRTAHQFQALTESNKPDPSYRKGIYLSNVSVSKQDDGEGDAVHFNLLRCSTNLEGPTDMFKSVDLDIVKKVNEAAGDFFDSTAPLNHVLAQIYENFTLTEGNTTKEKKARIKSHSDKTKDMPSNGLIAFCTFYSKDISDKTIKKGKPEDADPYDHLYKHGSVLTRLRFKLKKCVVNDVDRPLNLVQEFTVTLHPNSVFLIPLSTNRLYAHEIVPPNLPATNIPTRLGYVIRCSKTEGIFRDGKTYIQEGDDMKELLKPTENDIAGLKDMYFKENMSADVVDYGKIYFSLNDGDYKKPNF